jgi:hypothetical protein
MTACTHFVGFKDDRYWNAVKVFGRPHFIHGWWDRRARRLIARGDTIVFAAGSWRQRPKKFNAPDIIEKEPL